MSVADMLAAARGQGAAGAKTSPAPAKAEPAAPQEPVAEEAPPPAAAPKKLSASEKPKSVDDIVAFCRKTDGK